MEAKFKNFSGNCQYVVNMNMVAVFTGVVKELALH
jgi:hypothetical protein